MKKGLVSRALRPDDRRYIGLALTEAGRALYARILPVVQEVNRDLMSELEPAEIDLLDQLLERVQARAAQMQEAAPDLPLADRRHGGTTRAGGDR